MVAGLVKEYLISFNDRLVRSLPTRRPRDATNHCELRHLTWNPTAVAGEISHQPIYQARPPSHCATSGDPAMASWLKVAEGTNPPTALPPSPYLAAPHRSTPLRRRRSAVLLSIPQLSYFSRAGCSVRLVLPAVVVCSV